jgi:OPT oligopeptide transporter protein
MGVGLFSFSLDWTLVAYYFPVATPWWSSVNLCVGTIFWQWFVTPVTYYSNLWNTPVLDSPYSWRDGTQVGIQNSVDIFNRNGTVIHIKRPNLNEPSVNDENYILSQNFKLDLEKFKRHAPFYLTEMFLIQYFCSLMQITVYRANQGYIFSCCVVVWKRNY